MAVRNSSLSSPNVISTLPLRSDFPRRVVVLFSVIIALAIGIYFLFILKPETQPLVRLVFTDLSLGVAAGFTARIQFGQRSLFIRFITAAAALITGLLLIGILTGWSSGIGPFIFWRNTIDWVGLVHLTLGMGCIFLTLEAWSKPVQVIPNSNPVATAAHAAGRPKIKTAARPKRKRKQAAVSSRAAANTESTSSEIQITPAASRTKAHRKQTKSNGNHSQAKPQVRLSSVENHLCPYCLEPVVRRDPRGVVECEICHTLHHADCWAITGSCQVPHFTA